MTHRERFGERMKHHRDTRTVTGVAGKIGCDRKSIENMEAGRSFPRLPVYIRLCRYYGLTPAQRAELDEIASGAAEGDGGEA